MACKRSSVRLRYPPQTATDRGGFFIFKGAMFLGYARIFRIPFGGAFVLICCPLLFFVTRGHMYRALLKDIMGITN